MKKIKISLFMLALITLAPSCNDTLDITQPGQVSPDETFVNMDAVRKNLFGIYSTLSIFNQIEFNSIWTDEVAIGVSNGGQGINDGSYAYLLNSNNSYSSSIWNSNYSAINNFNRFIFSANKFKENNILTPAEVIEVDHMIAEARALRAFAYNELLTYFAVDYKNDNSLGVILFDDIPTVSTPKKSRATVGEVYTFIEEDLQFVLNNLSSNVLASRGTTPYFVSEDFVYALKSRISLYRGKYQEAIDFANNVLVDEIPLATTNYYRQVFKDETSRGVIFKLSRIPGNSRLGNIWVDNTAGLNGALYFEAGRSLYNLFSDDDIRKTVTFHPDALISPDYQNSLNYLQEDIIPVGKYIESKGQVLLGDHKVFRVSELTLIKAEAYIMLNNYQDAENELNVLLYDRIDSQNNTITLTNDRRNNLKILLQERRKELAFEGFRWVDLKRLGVDADVTFDRDPMDCNFNSSCNPPAPGSYKFTLPIPISEINVNPLMVQNPNY